MEPGIGGHDGGSIEMRGIRTKLALTVALTLALAATIGAGAAQGAKVTEKASGGVLPDEVIAGPVDIQTPLIQEFKLKGSKVKGKQILDVNVVVNSTSADLGANAAIDAVLVSPKSRSSAATATTCRVRTALARPGRRPEASTTSSTRSSRGGTRRGRGRYTCSTRTTEPRPSTGAPPRSR
jgi:hypothetical protein